jgi:hypothetical protein
LEFNLDGVNTYVDFEAIKTLNDPYLTLLGIDWDFNNDTILNLKQRWMPFEKEGCIFIHSLDPTLSELFVEPMEEVLDEGSLDNFYNLTVGH